MGNTVGNTVTLWRTGQCGAGDHGAKSEEVHKGGLKPKSNTEFCKGRGQCNGGNIRCGSCKNGYTHEAK